MEKSQYQCHLCERSFQSRNGRHQHLRFTHRFQYGRQVSVAEHENLRQRERQYQRFRYHGLGTQPAFPPRGTTAVPERQRRRARKQENTGDLAGRRVLAPRSTNRQVDDGGEQVQSGCHARASGIEVRALTKGERKIVGAGPSGPSSSTNATEIFSAGGLSSSSSPSSSVAKELSLSPLASPMRLDNLPDLDVSLEVDGGVSKAMDSRLRTFRRAEQVQDAAPWNLEEIFSSIVANPSGSIFEVWASFAGDADISPSDATFFVQLVLAMKIARRGTFDLVEQGLASLRQ